MASLPRNTRVNAHRVKAVRDRRNNSNNASIALPNDRPRSVRPSDRSVQYEFVFLLYSGDICHRSLLYCVAGSVNEGRGKGHSAFHPSRVDKWRPALAGRRRQVYSSRGLHEWQIIGKKGRGHTLDITPLGEGTSVQKCSGKACVVEEFHSFTCTRMQLSTNGMNHTCLCLPSQSLSSFTNPLGMEGWVGLGDTTVSKQSAQDC